MDKTIFESRRKDFMNRIGEGVAIFAAAPIRLRNNDVEYEYRQDSNFFYLTGFEEPESIALLAPGHPKYEYILFVRARDREKEIWTGYRAGVEGAIRGYGAEMAFTNDRFPEIASELLQDRSALYYSLHRNPEIDDKIFSLLDSVRQKQRSGINGPSMIVDPYEILSEMRLRKTNEEIEALQKAANITAQGHLAAMRAARPGVYEYQIQAELEYVFRKNGSTRNGYSSIVGSGPNSCILHYVTNSRQMQNGELLLVDAGAEYDYYTADITRTFPVNGRFSTEQKAIYDIVLEAQKQAIDCVRPGNSTETVHRTAVMAITQGLISLGLLQGSVEENMEAEKFKKYFMHKTGHWLGMDVHDPGRLKDGNQWRPLQPGMVLTVEPGIYIAEDDDHASFRNIGVRIEDDVLVTENGCSVLSAACPKEPDQLESIIGKGDFTELQMSHV